jgi:hypothetical protein
MKKNTLIVLLLCSFTILFAQAPQKMSYQSVIRKTDGSLVANTLVNIKVSILQGSASGTASYVETQTVTTNANGLATLAIGGGTAVTGTFASINWGTGTYFIKTETDPAGGTNYTISGTSQLLSVPYALYAGSSQNKGKTSIVITGNITNEQAASQIAAEFGPYTENVYIQNTTGLTSIDLCSITNLVNLFIIKNSNLTTISLCGLSAIYDSFIIVDNNALSSLSFPALTSLPPKDGDLTISRNSSLTTISFPLLNSTGYLAIEKNSTLTSLSFPALTSLSTGIRIQGNSKLTSIGLPSLSSITVGGYYAFNYNALPTSQINIILNKWLTVTPLTGKSINLESQTPSAPPTGQGITDKATLIRNGNNVYTD